MEIQEDKLVAVLRTLGDFFSALGKFLAILIITLAYPALGIGVIFLVRHLSHDNRAVTIAVFVPVTAILTLLLEVLCEYLKEVRIFSIDPYGKH